MTRYLFLILLFLLISCRNSQKIQSSNFILAKDLNPIGRAEFTVKRHLELISSAAHFTIQFTGTSCSIYAYLADPGAHNYLQYELDGKYIKRIKINGVTSHPYKIVETTNDKHTLKIFKATEAHTGPIYIEKIEALDIQSKSILSKPIIEFIGNSITCGAAADPSEVACGNGVYHDQHNAYMAYGPRVCRAIDAEFILSSISGYGIYRTWNQEGPSVPEVYENSDFQLSSARKWDFNKLKPAVVSIALGTNDLSIGDGIHERLPFDSTRFENEFVQFVKIIKSKYGNVQIALLSSPMIHGENRLLLQRILSRIKNRIDSEYNLHKKIATYFFNPMKARGCTGHPNLEDHEILANELKSFFEKLLRIPE